MPRCTCTRNGEWFIDRNGQKWIVDPCNLPPYQPPMSPSYNEHQDRPPRSMQAGDRASPARKKKSNLKTPKKVHFDDHPHMNRQPAQKSRTVLSGGGKKRELLMVDLDIAHLNQVLSLRRTDDDLQTHDGCAGPQSVPHSRFPTHSFDSDTRSSGVKFPPRSSSRQASWASNLSQRPMWYSNVDGDCDRGLGRERYRYQSVVTRTSERTTWREQEACLSDTSDDEDATSTARREDRHSSTASIQTRIRTQRRNREKWLRFFTT